MTTRIAASKNSAIAAAGTKRIRLLKNASVRYDVQFWSHCIGRFSSNKHCVKDVRTLTYVIYQLRRAEHVFHFISPQLTLTRFR